MREASSKSAQEAYKIIQELQEYFRAKLEKLSKDFGENRPFEIHTWRRNEGLHGGGKRYEASDERLFNRASINISQVHYDDIVEKNLTSASALSTIIHPKNPHLPSIHIHISLTELRDGLRYWRIMADLNPSLFYEEDKNNFENLLKGAAPDFYEEAMLQGENYFYIPALERHRGVSHFYLEEFTLSSLKEEMTFAKHFTQSVIDGYRDILHTALTQRCSFSSKEITHQLHYHTLYLFQVLTLDRGTTAGILVHNQNDLGILASLPAYVDKTLLLSWAKKLQMPQEELLLQLTNAINNEGHIDNATKLQFAYILREHYKKYPDAITLQASGNTIPTTLQNHITL